MTLIEIFTELVDAVVYINLEDRQDRNETMKLKTSMFGNKVHRFNAIKSKNGALGCTKSHIGVLQLAIKSNWKNVLILEDDIVWNETEKGYKNLIQLMHNRFDVIMLGASYCKFDDKTFKLTKANCSHAYIVNSHYYEHLLSNLQYGERMLECIYPINEWRYTLDVNWNKLVENDNWFLVLPNIMYQRNDYSDIDNAFKVYKNSIFLTSETLDIREALWGADKRIMDVTAEVKQFSRNTDICLKSSLFKTDPAIGYRKCLVLEYTDDSIEFFSEGEIIRVTYYP